MSCWSTSFLETRISYFETPPGIDLEISTAPGTPDLGLSVAFRVLDLLSKGHGFFFPPMGKSTNCWNLLGHVYMYNIFIYIYT